MPCPDSALSRPSVLGILLTSHCNISCRHCCNSSGPTAHRSVDTATVAGLIDDAARIGTITEIGLSGGEPFMFPRLLGDILRHARDCGLAASVTTNGFWGRSRRAGALLAGLKADGLTAVCISTSRFHQEFIGIDTVVRAAGAALDAGLTVTVNVVSSAALHPDAVRAALGDRADRVGVVVMPCLPAGRAASMLDAAEFPETSSRPLGSCHRHFDKLAVDLDGDVWPCCSPGGFTAPLRMGNIADAPVDRIVARSGANTLLAVLDTVGPAFFLPFLRRAEGLDDLPTQFSDPCHLCHAMLSSPRAAAVVQEACDRLTDDIRRLPPEERPPGRLGRIAALAEQKAA